MISVSKSTGNTGNPREWVKPPMWEIFRTRWIALKSDAAIRDAQCCGGSKIRGFFDRKRQNWGWNPKLPLILRFRQVKSHSVWWFESRSFNSSVRFLDWSRPENFIDRPESDGMRCFVVLLRFCRVPRYYLIQNLQNNGATLFHR